VFLNNLSGFFSQEVFTMSKADHGVSMKRFLVIPRTLIFITRGNEVLLLKGSPEKRLWANKYNGIGGHIERGEDALNSARRELEEESGLVIPNLWFCGSVIVDVQESTGVSIFIFRGEYCDNSIVVRSSEEGKLDWCKTDDLPYLPLVQDLQILLPVILDMQPEDIPFFARSFYDQKDQLQLIFS
jgi:8-oxo-dGTP diphosphatase